MIVAVAQGIGDPSVPADAIAVVEDAPNGTITKEEFDRALVQTAARQGIKEVPETTDPQYQTLADAAQSDLLLARWVAGEAQERGIETTDREIDDELEKVKQQQFGSEQAFEKFLDQSGFTHEEARAAGRAAAALRPDPVRRAARNSRGDRRTRSSTSTTPTRTSSSSPSRATCA